VLAAETFFHRGRCDAVQVVRRNVSTATSQQHTLWPPVFSSRQGNTADFPETPDDVAASIRGIAATRGRFAFSLSRSRHARNHTEQFRKIVKFFTILSAGSKEPSRLTDTYTSIHIPPTDINRAFWPRKWFIRQSAPAPTSLHRTPDSMCYRA